MFVDFQVVSPEITLFLFLIKKCLFFCDENFIYIKNLTMLNEKSKGADRLNVLVKSKFAIPNPFGSVSCFVIGVCLSNYSLYLFLIHQARYLIGYQ